MQCDSTFDLISSLTKGEMLVQDVEDTCAEQTIYATLHAGWLHKGWCTTLYFVGLRRLSATEKHIVKSSKLQLNTSI